MREDAGEENKKDKCIGMKKGEEGGEEEREVEAARVEEKAGDAMASEMITSIG